MTDLIERMALASWGKEEYFPLCWQEGMTAILDAIRETHAIVPREPTEAMIEASKGGAIVNERISGIWKRGLLANWRAMIEAGEVKP